MEEMLIYVGAVILSFPLIYLISYKAEKLRLEKEFLHKFLEGYLIIFCITYGIFSVLGVYFNIYANDLTTYICISFMFTALLLFTKLRYEGLDTKIYLLSFIIYLIIALFILFKVFYTPLSDSLELIPFEKEQSGVLAIILFIIILIPMIILVITHFYLVKRARKFSFEVSIKELKQITLFFGITMMAFAIISMIIFFISFDPMIMFSGDIFDTGVGDQISAIFYSVLNHPLFMFTAVITMIAGFTTVFGNPAYSLVGNLVMAMMPMIMWLSSWFGAIPSEIIALFLGFDLFGRIFYIVIVTMMLVIVISAWRLFTGIVSIT